MATCCWASPVSPLLTLSRTQADACDSPLCSASLHTLSVWCVSRGHVSENSKSVRNEWAGKGQLCQLFPRTLTGNCELGPSISQTRAKSSGGWGWHISCGDPFCHLPRANNHSVPVEALLHHRHHRVFPCGSPDIADAAGWLLRGFYTHYDERACIHEHTGGLTGGDFSEY